MTIDPDMWRDSWIAGVDPLDVLKRQQSVFGGRGDKIKKQLQHLWNGDAIEVNAPVIVELKITSAEPGVKGDTVSGATKKAILETGVEVQVPLFVNENETIKVDTRDMSYVGRSKS